MALEADGRKVEVGSPPADAGQIRRFAVTSSYKGNTLTLGTLTVHIDVAAVDVKIAEQFALIVMNQALIMAILSVIIFFVFRGMVMRHLERIAGYARALDVERLGTPLELARKPSCDRLDELGDVVNGINEMRVRLQQETARIIALNRAFERFVPKDFLTHLDKPSVLDVELGQGVGRTMTVLFTDLRSFTSLSEKMTPHETFAFLNEYFSEMGPIIRANHGFIDKFIGDAIMALFDRDPDEAVQAAIGMIRQLACFNAGRAARGLPAVGMGVGIHRGQLMLGTIGESNRMDTTVIADAVNAASRLEGMTKKYGAAVLVSDVVVSALRQRAAFTLRELDRVQAKGKSEPLTIFEVVDADPPELAERKRAILPQWDDALRRYRNRAFTEALAGFSACADGCPGDKAAAMYLERSRAFIAQGCPPDWNGVTVLDSK